MLTITCRDVSVLFTGIFIGMLVIVLFYKVFNLMGENFANKREQAFDINNKVGYMFNNGGKNANYNEFKNKINYGDAVLYDDMKKLAKKGPINETTIESVL